MKPKSFFFHYNKPASVAQGRNVLTVHWQGACHLVNDIDCHVPIKTRARKSQPRCVMAGKAKTVRFFHGREGTLNPAKITAVIR